MWLKLSNAVPIKKFGVKKIFLKKLFGMDALIKVTVKTKKKQTINITYI